MILLPQIKDRSVHGTENGTVLVKRQPEKEDCEGCQITVNVKGNDKMAGGMAEKHRIQNPTVFTCPHRRKTIPAVAGESQSGKA